MTERKRASHFALMDTAFPADRKFVRLAARAVAPIEYAAAVGVYWLLLADARRSKSPDIDWDEFDEYRPQIELLRSVGLLEDDGFPPETFERWAPAYRAPGTNGYERVPKGTQSTHRDDASIQFSSIRGEGGVGEAGLWNGRGTHDGRHGSNCLACYPNEGAA